MEGWYDANTFAPAGDVILNPEYYMILRNATGTAAQVKLTGSVPVNPFGIGILSRNAGPQDNTVNNPYPADITFANSDLISSGAVRPSSDALNPTDIVLMFDSNLTGFNTTPTIATFYFTNGGELDGWYDANTFAPSNDRVIPGGRAIIIRKGSSATDDLISWAPSIPYSL